MFLWRVITLLWFVVRCVRARCNDVPDPYCFTMEVNYNARYLKVAKSRYNFEGFERYTGVVPGNILSDDISGVDGIPFRACQLFMTKFGYQFPHCKNGFDTEYVFVSNDEVYKDVTRRDTRASDNTCCLTREKQCPPHVSRLNVYAEKVDFWFTVYRDMNEYPQCSTVRGPGDVTEPEQADPRDPAVCLSCMRVDASTRNCGDGMYATAALEVDATNLVLNEVKCMLCGPGTFNSCQQGDSCQWNIPKKGETTVSTSINSIFAFPNIVPVQQCYPCVMATGSSTTNHYASLTTRITPKMSTIPRLDDVKLFVNGRERYRFYCPGNINGKDGVPRMCGDNYIANIDMSACVCMEGKYEVIVDGAPRCVDCPAGSYCTNGVRRDCPDDFYQAITGQASCNDCRTLDRCIDGFRRRRCVAGNKHEIPPCIKCDQCRHIYSDDKNDRAECYRI